MPRQKQFRTPYARLLDEWLSRSRREPNEVAREAGMRPQMLQDMRNSAGPPPESRTNIQLAVALGRLSEIDTLLLYSHAAYLDYQLRRMLADAAEQINRGMRTGPGRAPGGLLEAVSRGESGDDKDDKADQPADTSSGQQSSVENILTGLIGQQKDSAEKRLLTSLLAGQDSDQEDQGTSNQMQLLMHLLGGEGGESLQALQLLTALMQQPDSSD